MCVCVCVCVCVCITCFKNCYFKCKYLNNTGIMVNESKQASC